MAKAITIKEISEMIAKTPQTLNHMKRNNPIQYEVTRLGAICKKNGITEEMLIEILIQQKDLFI